MENEFIKTLKKRRSIYSLTNDVPISKEQISEILKHAIKHSPSAFNSQSSRAIILFENHHFQLWDIVEGTLRTIVPQEDFSRISAKIDTFRKGLGSILFFEDVDVINCYEKEYPLYAKNFSDWAEQSTGIAQFAVWTSLANENIGASLQHYNPLIDNKVKETWNLPDAWILKAQMPFGGIESMPNEKEFISDEERIRIF